MNRALNTLWRGRRGLFEFSGYHLLLTAFGLAILLAYWLPRLFSGREPAAAALLIALGLLIFGWLPGMPDALSPLTRPLPWEILSELCVIVGLFGVGLRIDRIKDFKRWWPTVRLLAIAMPLTILAVSMFGWWVGAMTLGGGLLSAPCCRQRIPCWQAISRSASRTRGARTSCGVP